MFPIDPVRPVPADERPPMAPPFVDESPELAAIEQGLEEAENERREAVADAYEANARLSDDPEEALDDVDYTLAESENEAPELAAMRSEDEDEDEYEDELP